MQHACDQSRGNRDWAGNFVTVRFLGAGAALWHDDDKRRGASFFLCLAVQRAFSFLSGSLFILLAVPSVNCFLAEHIDIADHGFT